MSLSGRYRGNVLSADRRCDRLGKKGVREEGARGGGDRSPGRPPPFLRCETRLESCRGPDGVHVLLWRPDVLDRESVRIAGVVHDEALAYRGLEAFGRTH